MKKIINKIEKRINELEERNTESRAFCRLLDENNKEDKKILDDELNMRKMRIFATLELKDLIEEIKAESN